MSSYGSVSVKACENIVLTMRHTMMKETLGECSGCIRTSHGAPCAWKHTKWCIDKSLYNKQVLVLGEKEVQKAEDEADDIQLKTGDRRIDYSDILWHKFLDAYEEDPSMVSEYDYIADFFEEGKGEDYVTIDGTVYKRKEGIEIRVR